MTTDAPARRAPCNLNRYGCAVRITARQRAVQELQSDSGTEATPVPDDDGD